MAVLITGDDNKCEQIITVVWTSLLHPVWSVRCTNITDQYHPIRYTHTKITRISLYRRQYHQNNTFPYQTLLMCLTQSTKSISTKAAGEKPIKKNERYVVTLREGHYLGLKISFPYTTACKYVFSPYLLICERWILWFFFSKLFILYRSNSFIYSIESPFSSNDCTNWMTKVKAHSCHTIGSEQKKYCVKK